MGGGRGVPAWMSVIRALIDDMCKSENLRTVSSLVVSWVCSSDGLVSLSDGRLVGGWKRMMKKLGLATQERRDSPR